jgi:two-component system NtrC family response regulator
MKRAVETGHASLKGSSVLIVGGEPDFRSRLRTALGRQVGLVDSAEGAIKAAQLMARCHFDFLVVDAGLRDSPALGWIAGLQRAGANARILLVAERPNATTIIEAMRCGVADVLEHPLKMDALVAALQRASGGKRPGPTPPRLAETVNNSVHRKELIGDSGQMRQVRELIRRIAPLPGTVLIQGETGTGKELVARWLHALSSRRGAFVAVNCGAISPELLESELFGHTKGAFTNAHQGREGLFVAARNGTLYLDEISEMPVFLEVKLLRVLEEGAIRPVGADHEVPVDVRIVASTQHDLAALVRDRRFREDLYFRLNVAQVNLPPLRDRLEDVPTLARHFMACLAADFGMPPIPLDSQAMTRLQAHAWPGNVRELKNAIERSLMLGEPLVEPVVPGPAMTRKTVAEYPLDWTLDEVKEHHMARVLRAMGGNKSAAARCLGISRKTLERRLMLEFGEGEPA